MADSRGSIRDPEYLAQTRMYSWELIGRYLPESMQSCVPTDIDYILEKFGHFLVFEFKTAGVGYNVGQMKVWKAMQEQLQKRMTIIFVIHPRLTLINPFVDPISVKVRHWVHGRAQETGQIPQAGRPSLVGFWIRIWAEMVIQQKSDKFMRAFKRGQKFNQK